jgi:hypothetical protein
MSAFAGDKILGRVRGCELPAGGATSIRTLTALG